MSDQAQTFQYWFSLHQSVIWNEFEFGSTERHDTDYLLWLIFDMFREDHPIEFDLLNDDDRLFCLSHVQPFVNDVMKPYVPRSVVS